MNALRDLGALGHPFTWSNKRSEGLIEERLDRFMAFEEWRSMFPKAIVENIIWDGFDYSPSFYTRPKGYMEVRSRNSREEGKTFRFEARWIYQENFDTNLEIFWGASKNTHGNCWSRVI